MSDSFVVMIVGILLVPVGVLGAGVLWGVRRRRPGLGLISCVLLVGYLGVGVRERLVPGFGWLYDRWFTRDLVGAAASLGTPLRSFETPRSPMGDGYSILVFRLPPALAERFRFPSPDLAGYPRRTEDRADWSVHPWSRTPAPPAQASYVEFALGGAPDSLQRDVRSILNAPGAWYAFLYKEASPMGPGDDSYLMNVDFFVVDLASGRIVLINQNT